MLTLRYLLPVLAAVLLCSATPGAAQEGDQQPAPENATDWGKREFWQTATGGPVPEGWQFNDGEVALVSPRKGGGNILTPPLPPNFELSWQWKIEKGVNSGLKYRVRKFGKQNFNNSYLGVEYQIIDSKPDSDSKGSTASIYDLVSPKKEKTLHPPGEWNQSRVVAVGDKMEHYLNGELVASAVASGPSWDTTIAFSKFYGAADFGRPKTGDRIMLTDHGGKVTYKDFKFVPVDAPEQLESPRNGPFLANATRNSWADQESIVIWTRTTRLPEMISDGPKFVDISRKKAGELSKLKDEDQLLDVQLPEGAKLDEMFGSCPGAPGKVRLSYFPGKQRNRIVKGEWIATSAESDFTAQFKLKGLRPNTQYTTIVEAQTGDGEPSAVLRGAFRTAPKDNSAEAITFCITTCHDFIRRDDGMLGHKIYPAMKKIQPNFIVHAGDIEYYDKPSPWALTKALMRFKWGRIFALPSNRDFYNSTTSYFIKDDHDTLSNDSWPGRTYGAVTFEEGVKLFNEEQFPSRAPRYANIRWGRDIEIWILEGRDYRSPNNMPDGPEKSILGEKQKAWLFKTLDESQAKFKLICSPTPIVGPDRANKKDNHANEIFAHEGEQLREKLASVPGVIVFCGDRHWQYASVDEQRNLWEFGCGPGSEKHQLGWKPGDKRPVHRFLRVKGGFLSGELSYPRGKKEPQLTIRHHTVTGKRVSEFVFPEKEEQEPTKLDGGKLEPVKHLIDTHIHLYDTRRDVAMSWPPKDDKVLYKPHLPQEYSKLARAAGVTGVVIVEASNHLKDNRWVLDLVKEDDLYIGLVGNIDVNREDFEKQLTKLKKDRRLVGIRARGPEPIDFTNERVLANLAVLAKHDLTMDYLTNGGGIPGIETIDAVARKLPKLRIVVNHCLGYDFDGKAPSEDWIAAVNRLAENPNVTCKISGLYQRSVPQPAPQDIKHYQKALDVLWEAFGKKRLIYGSNWPVTKRTDSYVTFLRLVDKFISAHGQDARERYYWKNAAEAYRLPLK